MAKKVTPPLNRVVETGDAPYRVYGVVRNADGTLAQGLTVQASDRDLRGEQVLGRAIVKDGTYDIPYTDKAFDSLEKDRADVVLTVYDVRGAILYTSIPFFNATATLEVNIDLGETPYRGPSEHEVYLAAVTPLLGKQLLKDLREDDVEDAHAGKYRDISFLAGETGLSAINIQYLVTAAQLEASTNVEQAAFYGLLRQRLPATLAALVAQPTATLRNALETSLRDNLVPAVLAKSLDNILRQLQSLQQQQPAFIVEPQVLLNTVTDLTHLPDEASRYVTQRIQAQFQQALLNLANDGSAALQRALEGAVTTVRYPTQQENTLNGILSDIVLPVLAKDPALAEEAAQLVARLRERDAATVRETLLLDTPLKDHPFFQDEVRTGKRIAYTRLAGLPDTFATVLNERHLVIEQLDEPTLSILVAEGVLDEPQKRNILLATTLGKLTNDNLPLVTALWKRNVESAVDFASWETEEWQELIAREQVVLPRGETPATYADTLVFNLQRTYPSHVMMGRVLHTRSTGGYTVLDTVDTLLAHNEKLLEDTQPAAINWEGIDDTRRKKMEADLQGLSDFANAYRQLGVADLINDRTLGLDEKKKRIGERLQPLQTFYTNNPAFDLRMVNFFDRADQTLNWANIAEADQPRVKKQLMSYQRALAVADTLEDSYALLRRGYDSATRIAGKTEAEFVATSGLAKGKARSVYAKAQNTSAHVAHELEAMRDTVWGNFKDLGMSNLRRPVVNDLREIDGFSDLFGCQNYCDCDACKSILSPAAYFTDLMYFIQQHVSKPVFIAPNRAGHPLYLKTRRRDLWTLDLTCENTNTLIPYLTIVNEVLEAYLNGVVGGNIYEKISDPDEKISFALPFNLPLEELRIYLGHFGIGQHDVFRILKKTEDAFWRARLKLSFDEFNIITTPDTADVKFRYGNPASFTNFDVQEFIRIVGLTREQLDKLLALGYHPDLRNITISKANKNDLENCQEVMNNLTHARLDFIHRFLRLQKKTSWTIPELDLLLLTLQAAGLITESLNADVVRSLARLADLQEKLKLSVEELCAMVDKMPVSAAFPAPVTRQADRRLYERLFDLRKIFGEANPVTHAVNETVSFHHYSLNTTDPTDKTIDPNTPLLLGGLGISEIELLLLFDLLKDEMPFNATGDCTLDRGKLSLLYRHARLARALRLSIDEFIQALKLNFTPANLIVDSLAHIFTLYAFRDGLRTSPFSVSEIRLILKGEESATIKYKNDVAAVGAMVQEAQALAEPDKVKALQAVLSKSFNLSSLQLADVLQWVNSDINSAGILAALSATFTDGVPDNPADLDALLTLAHEQERVLLVISNLKLKEAPVTYLTTQSAALGITDKKNLTLANIQALTYYKALISTTEEGEKLTQTVLDHYLATTAFSLEDIVLLADLWQQDTSQIASLVNALTFSAVPIEALQYLGECLQLCKTLGINGYSLQILADDNGFANQHAARDVAVGAFSSKYEDETVRREKLEPYLDRANVKKRDALCDYVIARHQDLKFKDLRDIYAFFLLDVEMSGCFRTSRLVCAISGLQLYLHRCLANLEQSDPDLNPGLIDIHVDPTLIPAEEWEWRKNYRVWEANRKVFLYPENYIEPDLRDNKTPVFKSLEEELLQQKITKASAEAAYKKYVSEFAALARLRIAGSYYDAATKTYYFFGRTQQDPPQYYYRQWIGGKVWTPWEKIELPITSSQVSALIHLGKLYIFWGDIKEVEKSKIENGTNKIKKFTYYILLNYSFLDENKRWQSPQKLDFDNWAYEDIGFNEVFADEFKAHYTTSRSYRKIYAHIGSGKIYVHYLQDRLAVHDGEAHRDDRSAYLNLFFNRLEKSNNHASPGSADGHLKLYQSTNAALGLSGFITPRFAEAEFNAVTDSTSGLTIVTNQFSTADFQPDLALIQGKPGDYVVKLGTQQYLMRYVNIPIQSIHLKRLTIRLSTSLADELGEVLFTHGLERFLSLKTQKDHTEHAVGVDFIQPFELLSPYNNPNHIDFKGAYGEYYRELYFHIPFLIANHLNANQKFKEAKWWYERIFDPTANESPDDDQPTDRNWRYIEFREVTVPKMKDILTDEAAIEQYKKDPFNPHAIARLRMSAYQKAIVMKYIDNLLDWGDYLFGQDTMESINEATMLYVLAYDILGKRPAKLGRCASVNESRMNYETIGPAIDKGSEFMIELENWHWSTTLTKNVRQLKSAALASHSMLLQPTGRTLATAQRTATHALAPGYEEAINSTRTYYRVATYAEAAKDRRDYLDNARDWEFHEMPRRVPGFRFHVQTTPVFCVPPNTNLLDYWTRVEDRLYKIRHCMNISGVRRSLALFQPPIDPMALVRAKAAGLSLDEILAMLSAPLPSYRFTYLVQKAKEYTQTVQSFGNALLGALEKKDGEELALLQSLHERNILRMTHDIKKQQVREAQYQYQSSVEAVANVRNRIDYYQGLIDEGLTGWEITQQISKHTSSVLQIADGAMRLYAGISYLIPQVGSPFAMKYGGKEFGDSASAFAEVVGSSVKIAQAISESAGLEATFQRREEEWAFQRLVNQQELRQVEQQRLAADIRQLVAEKELEIHEKTMEQSDATNEFYRNKFSNLGLYTFLSGTLNRLYRQAYNLAHDLAKAAERAYAFERDDDTIFIAGDNWQFDRAGLLAGEKLTLQLQRMEKSYIEQDKRQYEVTQSFSVALLNPAALLNLKQTGTCEFTIPELMFDVFYPGQLSRLIKSVRVTLPCVAGAYTNISAKLTLKESKVRKVASTDPGDLVDVPHQKLTSIATSHAQNDGGLFELNFRDERYLPFEGAGAVSTWGLELPGKLRLFNYDTISDVIVHISYTAKDDGLFRTTVENQISDMLVDYASSAGMYRLISLKHDFPNTFHQLLNPPDTIQQASFELTAQHFPYFLAGRDLMLTSPLTVYIKPKGADPVPTGGLSLEVNGADATGWSVFETLQAATAPASGNPVRTWNINAGANGLDKETLDDILILMKYTV